MAMVDLVWLLAVLSTGIAAGAMAGHALLLGRFFGWIFETGRTETFRRNYPAFMQAKKPGRLFDNLFTVALVLVTAYAAILWLTGRLVLLALLAAGSQWLFVLIFFGSGFASLERLILSEGDVGPENVQRFQLLNTPLTALSTVLLLASFACLLLLKV